MADADKPTPPATPPSGVTIDVRDLYAEIGELTVLLKVQAQMLERQSAVISALQARLAPASDSATEP